MNKIFLIIKEDLTQYPPVLSMIKVLLSFNKNVVVVGPYSDFYSREILKKEGVALYCDVELNVKAAPLIKIKEQLRFKSYVKSVIEKEYHAGDQICVINEDTVCLLWSIIKNYNYIIYFLETPSYNVPLKYRIYAPSFKLSDACAKAKNIICCEYNRAHIIKGLYGLDYLPAILPNKYYDPDLSLDDIPQDISKTINEVEKKTKGKKIVLYQGVFNSGERRLEEFILAVNSLPDDYVLLAMGRGDKNFEFLKKKYSSERILFIDFICPPYHLAITRLAYIGVLSYFPVSKSFIQILNPLYCAPNKIFEYSRFGLPMISNDVPALKNVFKEFNCGEIVEYPMSTVQIGQEIMSISSNYEAYKTGAINYYNSVDVKNIIAGVFGFK